MKTTDKKDLWTKDVASLRKQVNDAQEKFASLKFDKEQNKLKNTREIFTKRKEIAVLKTIIRAKEEKK